MDLKIVIKRLRDIEPIEKSEKEIAAARYAATHRRGSVTFSPDLKSSENVQGRSDEVADSNPGVSDESSGADPSEPHFSEEPRESTYWNAAESVFDLSIPVLVSRQNSFVFYVYKKNRLQNPFSKSPDDQAADHAETSEASPDDAEDQRIHNLQPKNPKLLAETNAHHWKSAGSLYRVLPRGASVRGRRQSVITGKLRTDFHLDSPDAFNDAKAFWLAEGKRLIAEGNRLSTGYTHGDAITDYDDLEAQMQSLFASEAAEDELLARLASQSRRARDQLADGGPYGSADRP
eukprot:CAMPEP_0172154370 /NCGR_PEP_ID=MMETSP1050-20130122/1993_1 /TAXON_ID=233186 /ORGANISM="Cryptomonas curvata, Strain CCAP979/52" /LENGTH=289 /DNA_ID=CAMNT_0012823071 /DNA_START=15 /DNA_END=880 /DNA_ORIENTATION=+